MSVKGSRAIGLSLPAISEPDEWSSDFSHLCAMMLERQLTAGAGQRACDERLLTVSSSMMNGQLQEHPLAELIREISAASLSGALRLERERVRMVLYFEAGNIVFAVSNLRAHRLSECLRRWQAVPEAQLAAAGEQPSDMRLAQSLFAAGIDRQAIEHLFTRQVTEIVCPALLWTDGLWSFDPRVRFTEDVRVKLEMNKILLEGTRRLPPEFAASRFRQPEEKLSPAQVAPDNPNLQPAEAFVLSRVDQPLSVHELTTACGLPEADTLRAAYTLAFAGFLERENWPRAFTDEEVRRSLAIQAATAKAAGGAADSSKEQAKSASADGGATDEQSEVEALFTRLAEATSHYQVLGVDRRADADEIKRAYHGLAKRFHPDRFHQDATLRARLEPAFARIAQAYEVLRDKRSRATYDFKLDGP